jgi:glycosyltransferase involved in cell wall biosynthesis
MSDLISILMPMRNAQAYVREALASLLAQRGVNLEVIVVDDGSTDRSAEVVRSMDDARIKLVPGPRKGIAAALNAGLAAATGDLLCRCDADDWYPADRLAWQRDVLAARPDVGSVCGTFATVTASGKRILEQNWGDRAESISGEIRRGVGRTHFCTFLTRTSVVRQLGGFRDYFIGTEDSDFILRLGEATEVWYEPKLSYLYRLHGESITHTQPSAQRKFLEQTMLEFQKQRLATGVDDLMRGNPPPIPTDLPTTAERTDDQVQHLLLGQAWRHHAAGRRGAAIREGLRALRQKPTNAKAWKSVAALAIKPMAASRPPAARPGQTGVA